MTHDPEHPPLRAHKAEPLAPRRVTVRTGVPPAPRPARQALERNAEPVQLPDGPYRPIEERGEAVAVQPPAPEEGAR